MLHIRQAFFHDRQHLEIRRTDLAGEALATRVILGAVAFTFGVEFLLLIKPADDLLQTGFHIPGNVAGLAQVFNDRGGEEPDRWRIGKCFLCREDGSAD